VIGLGRTVPTIELLTTMLSPIATPTSKATMQMVTNQIFDILASSNPKFSFHLLLIR
jgi:hypothetical protein